MPRNRGRKKAFYRSSIERERGEKRKDVAAKCRHIKSHAGMVPPFHALTAVSIE